MPITVTTWQLEMRDPAWLAPLSERAAAAISPLRIEHVPAPAPEYARFFYTAVGGDWWWLDRLPWTREEWRTRFVDPHVELWVASRDASPVGYFELERQAEANVELSYFGLLPDSVERGLGPGLLHAAVSRAWSLGARRVWVHTCSLDHPAARRTYEARGFRLFATSAEEVDLPDAPPGPWPRTGRPARLGSSC